MRVGPRREEDFPHARYHAIHQKLMRGGLGSILVVCHNSSNLADTLSPNSTREHPDLRRYPEGPVQGAKRPIQLSSPELSHL